MTDIIDEFGMADIIDEFGMADTSIHDIVRTLRRTFVVTNAIRLAPLLNRYLLQAGPPKTIVIPKAAQLAKMQEII